MRHSGLHGSLSSHKSRQLIYLNNNVRVDPFPGSGAATENHNCYSINSHTEVLFHFWIAEGVSNRPRHQLHVANFPAGDETTADLPLLLECIYHPESQGALERFHATLKSMLRAYCLETGNEWDEGVHLLFAAREVVQESLGFSPADLVFAHTVRGPLSLLYDRWLSDHKEQNLCDYVSTFRFRLHRVYELAKKNLSTAQSKMKTWYDKTPKAEHSTWVIKH